jgi:hypothetical protein
VGPVPIRVIALSLVAALSLGVWTYFLWPSSGRSGGVEESSCRQAENKDYSQLEDIANEVMGNRGDRVKTLSGCEDTGQPDPRVAVSVHQWKNGRPVRAYLEDANLRVDPTSKRFYPVDGEYEVSYYTEGNVPENGGREFMLIVFGWR